MDLGALSKRYTKISAHMLTELALGIEPLEDIAVRYGFTTSEWEAIKDREDLNRVVDDVRAELKESGVVFKNKSKLYADKLLEDVFSSAIGADTPVKDKVQALQTMAKLGGMDTSTQQQAQGSGFVISINIPSVTNTPSVSVSRADESVGTEDAEVIDPAEASLHLEFGDAKDKANKRPPVRRVAENDAKRPKQSKGNTRKAPAKRSKR